jgi:hypothetical protein
MTCHGFFSFKSFDTPLTYIPSFLLPTTNNHNNHNNHPSLVPLFRVVNHDLGHILNHIANLHGKNINVPAAVTPPPQPSYLHTLAATTR